MYVQQYDSTMVWCTTYDIRRTMYNGITVQRSNVRQYDSTIVWRTAYDIQHMTYDVQRYNGPTYGSTTAQWYGVRRTTYDVQCIMVQWYNGIMYGSMTAQWYDGMMVQRYNGPMYGSTIVQWYDIWRTTYDVQRTMVRQYDGTTVQ